MQGLGCAMLMLAAAGCWPVPGQNPDRTGHNPFEAGITSANVTSLHEVWRWRASADAAVSAPVTSPGGVHLSVRCGLVTLAPATGAVRWSQSNQTCLDLHGFAYSSDPHVASTPDGQRVILGLGYGFVRPPGFEESVWVSGGFDVDSGAPEGGADVGFVWGLRGSQLVGFKQAPSGPGLTGRTLLLATVDGSLQRSIPFGLAGAGSSGPVEVTLGAQYFFHSGYGALSTEPGGTAAGNGLRAFSIAAPDPGCGGSSECPVWATATDGRPSVAVLDGDAATAYVVTDVGTVYAIDSTSGAVRWTAAAGGAGKPALAGDQLFVPTFDGRVVVLNAAGCGSPTCTPQGEFSTSSTSPVSSPIVAGDVLYTTAGGSVFAFAAAGCGTTPCPPLWSVATGGASATSPVVTNGRLYVSIGNALIAYGLP
jgi:outer membrane protein assembly factor BamB